MHTPRVIIAGGAGTAGRALAHLLTKRGYRVTVLTQAPLPDSRWVQYLPWEPARPASWSHTLEGADGLVNLTRALDNELAIQALGEAMARCERGPAVWLQAASLAIYGAGLQGRAADERTLPGTGGGATRCHTAEQAFTNLPLNGVRRALYRIGLVLGGDPASACRVQRLAHWAEANDPPGEARLSWIHAGDLARLLYWGLRMEIISGPYNACVPNAATLADFRETCGPCADLEPPTEYGTDDPDEDTAGATQDCLVRAAPRRFIDIAYQFRNEDLAAVLNAVQPPCEAPRPAPAVALR